MMLSARGRVYRALHCTIPLTPSARGEHFRGPGVCGNGHSMIFVCTVRRTVFSLKGTDDLVNC
jgi:hypothetical protein